MYCGVNLVVYLSDPEVSFSFSKETYAAFSSVSKKPPTIPSKSKGKQDASPNPVIFTSTDLPNLQCGHRNMVLLMGYSKEVFESMHYTLTNNKGYVEFSEGSPKHGLQLL